MAFLNFGKSSNKTKVTSPLVPSTSQVTLVDANAPSSADKNKSLGLKSHANDGSSATDVKNKAKSGAEFKVSAMAYAAMAEVLYGDDDPERESDDVVVLFREKFLTQSSDMDERGLFVCDETLAAWVLFATEREADAVLDDGEKMAIAA
ncbi:hypothetical protein BG011_007600 [Mortierella polycephala]|uniref:Uncharacterized protein n=1 Tax=Mortierella polycephala TaxID=41804 RepID=A0A9P6PRR6_9FUNG|nr:hypothetical protein BG011_007600 [Mortierella polycephala]